MRKLKVSFLLCFIFALTSCSNSLSPNNYAADNVGVVSHVSRGVIVSKRIVTIGYSTRTGSTIGATTGAIAGASTGHNTNSTLAASVAGAVVGGVIGNTIDKKINETKANEYIIKLKSGKTISLVQTLDLHLPVGEHVMILYGAKTRMISDKSFHHTVVTKAKQKIKTAALPAPIKKANI